VLNGNHIMFQKLKRRPACSINYYLLTEYIVAIAKQKEVYLNVLSKASCGACGVAYSNINFIRPREKYIMATLFITLDELNPSLLR
jgi:hypothetical protein